MPISDNPDVCLTFAKWTTEVSHNHAISLKAVECYIKMLFHTIHEQYDKNRTEIFDGLLSIYKEYYPDYQLQNLSYIRETNEFDPTCEATMPLILPCIREGIEDIDFSYNDVLRTVVSIGGDTDTLCNIIGSVVANIYPISEHLYMNVWEHMSIDMQNIISQFKMILADLSAEI